VILGLRKLPELWKTKRQVSHSSLNLRFSHSPDDDDLFIEEADHNTAAQAVISQTGRLRKPVFRNQDRS
jgi:hypothetical protein